MGRFYPFLVFGLDLDFLGGLRHVVGCGCWGLKEGNGGGEEG